MSTSFSFKRYLIEHLDCIFLKDHIFEISIFEGLGGFFTHIFINSVTKIIPSLPLSSFCEQEREDIEATSPLTLHG